MIEMPQECALELVELAQAGMPNEVCGFLMCDWEIVASKNVSSQPHRSFAMPHEDVVSMMFYRRDDVLGMYHSHPSLRNYPSEDDQAIMRLYPLLRHFIATASNVFEWRMTDGGPRPVRRDTTTGVEGMAYPLLAPPATLRRPGKRPAA